MTSYKTFLNAVRVAISKAVNKVATRLARFEETATEKYNELAYVPIYETPVEDVWSGQITSVIQALEGCPALEAGKEYHVTIGEEQWECTAKIYAVDGEMGVYISDAENPFDGAEKFTFCVVSMPSEGVSAIFQASIAAAHETMTIQLIGDPVEVGKEWLHDYVDGKDTETANALQELANRVNAFLDSDDETLDELSEIIAYIKNNKNLIDSITNGKVNVSDIVNNLTTVAANKPLSATQGKVLKELIDTLTNTVAANKTEAATAASKAQSTANEAKSTANEAKSTANEAKNAVDMKIGVEADEGYVLTLSESPMYSRNKKILGVLCPYASQVVGGAFAYCTNLKFVDIPKATTIEESAFEGCSSLTSIVIPDGVTSIGSHAFYHSGLTSIMIPDSVTFIYGTAFNGCESLTSIVVSDGNAIYYSDGNCIISKGDNRLVAGCIASVIPADGSVTEIGYSAFRLFETLTEISIPDTIRYIDAGAFQGCGLTSITIPDSVVQIKNSAFLDCTALTSIAYTGTMEQWNAIYLGEDWNSGVPATEVVCSDGTVSLTTEEDS